MKFDSVSSSIRQLIPISKGGKGNHLDGCWGCKGIEVGKWGVRGQGPSWGCEGIGGGEAVRDKSGGDVRRQGKCCYYHYCYCYYYYYYYFH